MLTFYKKKKNYNKSEKQGKTYKFQSKNVLLKLQYCTLIPKELWSLREFNFTLELLFLINRPEKIIPVIDSGKYFVKTKTLHSTTKPFLSHSLSHIFLSRSLHFVISCATSFHCMTIGFTFSRELVQFTIHRPCCSYQSLRRVRKHRYKIMKQCLTCSLTHREKSVEFDLTTYREKPFILKPCYVFLKYNIVYIVDL